jgi:hypothetical protein
MAEKGSLNVPYVALRQSFVPSVLRRSRLPEMCHGFERRFAAFQDTEAQ